MVQNALGHFALPIGKDPAMATLDDIKAKLDTLGGLLDDEGAKVQAAHDAATNVTTVTETEQAHIDAATAQYTTNVNAAQAAADTAKTASDAAQQAVRDAVSELETMLETLKP